MQRQGCHSAKSWLWTPCQSPASVLCCCSRQRITVSVRALLTQSSLRLALGKKKKTTKNQNNNKNPGEKKCSVMNLQGNQKNLCRENPATATSKPRLLELLALISSYQPLRGRLPTAQHPPPSCWTQPRAWVWVSIPEFTHCCSVHGSFAPRNPLSAILPRLAANSGLAFVSD